MLSVDLHCHTKMSDGSTGIDELIYLARRLKLNTLSVTDHDTFAGAKRAKIIGERYGINVIMGAEISSFDKISGKSVHILCYMCDVPDRLEGLFKRIGEKRQKTAALLLQKLMRFYPVSPDMVSKKAKGSTNVFINHIVQVIMDIGYSLPYGILVEKILSSYNDLLIGSEYPDVCDVIDQIHEANGLAVLAHPAKSGVIDRIGDFIEMGLDGIEVWYPGVSADIIEKLESITNEGGLIATGGSNFHGMYSKGINVLGSCKTPMENLEEMKKRKQDMYKKI